MTLTADTITDEQLRELRDRHGEDTRLWDPAVVHACDVALGDVTFDASGPVQWSRRRMARVRCAELLNACPRKAAP